MSTVFQAKSQRRAEPGYLYPERSLVMGVLNVTPDSFSDGGKWLDPDAAISYGLEMLKQGADLIDVGGESTAPGTPPTSVDEEIARVVPVITELAAQGAIISCDTMHAPTAQAAVAAGAVIINDVSGGLLDPQMLPTVAALQQDWPQLSYLCQHWRADSQNANQHSVYSDVVAEVWQELQQRLYQLEAAGIDMRRVIVDPGLGFSKQGLQDWKILANLQAYLDSDYPVLIGPSRKRFLADFETDSSPRHPRDDATAAVAMHCAQLGVWALRVHQVGPVVAAVRVAQQIHSLRGEAARP